MIIGRIQKSRCKNRMRFYEKYIKRPVDFILAFMSMIILCPLIILIYIFVTIKLGSPAIFKQKRPGLNEKVFILYKFRTMTNAKDEKGNLLPDELRLTSFGKILRRTSLDELPELLNILKGDMSLVGPRPQLIKDMVFMTKKQRKRHIVRPGLTGLAQVSGRNRITWEEKLQYDLIYIDKITFIGDVKIIYKTILSVLARNDISTEGMETAMDLGDYLLLKGVINKTYYDAKQLESKNI